MEGMDCPDFGLAEENEAWSWMESVGLKEMAIRD